MLPYRALACGRAEAWEAARGTSAAPLYFPALGLANRTLQDGGILANNPAAIASRGARTLFPGRPVEALVSMGTGRKKPALVRDAGAAAAAAGGSAGGGVLSGALKSAVTGAVTPQIRISR